MKHDRRFAAILTVLAAGAVVTVFVADMVTPRDISMAPLAAVPVAMTAWFVRRTYLAILALAVGLSVTAVARGGDTPESGLATVAACIGLAAVVRMASRVRQPVAAPAGAALHRLTARLAATEPEAKHKPLTRREREVVDLAADGLTAREIAASLYIGERTVETHLANSYAKLGISSKRELILQRSRSHTA